MRLPLRYHKPGPRLRVGLYSLAILWLCSGLGCRMVSTGRNVDGVRYFQQGQYPVALQRFDAAMSIDPRNPDSYYNKAAIYHRTGLFSRDQNALTQAESLYQQCLAYSPNHVDCHRGLAVLLTETGRVNQSFELLKAWVARSPQNAEARVELARLYEEYGDKNAAQLALNDALAVDVNNWRAHAALGRLREQSGDLAQALQNYERSYSLNHFQPQLEQRIADLRGRVSPLAPSGTTPIPGIGSGTQSASAPVPFRRY